MPPKRAPKKMMTLETKLKILKLKDEGKRNIDTVNELGVGESAVRKILQKRDEIKQAAKLYGGGNFDKRSITSKKNNALIRMERYLAQYVRRKEKEGVPLDGRQIKNQAKLYYKVCVEKERDVTPAPFKASSGWLNNFLKRKEFKNVKFTGERASADDEAARSFPIILKGLIEEGGYTKDQIYNLDETRFYYKTMARSTFISKAQKQARGKKLDKSCFTIMFTLNLSGSNKMKPVICHTAKHPRCFNNMKSMSDHPNVYWYQSHKGWMTTTVLRDWLLNRFVPDARLKCAQQGIPFKVMLIMDNAPCHPHIISDLHPNVKVVFLPPNTTSLVQPLDQEVIANVKRFYHTKMFDLLRSKTETCEEIQEIRAEDLDGDADIDEPIPEPVLPPDAPQVLTPEMTVCEFWRKFTVKQALELIHLSWQEINEDTIHHAWRALVPHLCPTHPGRRVQAVHEVEQAVLAAAHGVAGCEEVTTEELQALIQEESECADACMQRVDSEAEQVENQVQEEPSPMLQQEMTMRNLSNILLCVTQLKEAIASNETDPFKGEEMCSHLDKLFREYSDKHRDGVNQRKQALITKF